VLQQVERPLRLLAPGARRRLLPVFPTPCSTSARTVFSGTYATLVLLFAFVARVGTTGPQTRRTGKINLYYKARFRWSSRLSAVISDRGRILHRHAYPNWSRNVHSSNQGDCIPSIALPRAIEASAIQAASNGMPLLPYVDI